MSVLVFDTHAYVKRLTSVGFTEEQAEVQAEALLVPSTDAPRPATPRSAEARRRSSWARMLRKVLEIEPLVCRRCGEEVVIVAWITRTDVIDRILRHRREKGLVSPFVP